MAGETYPPGRGTHTGPTTVLSTDHLVIALDPLYQKYWFSVVGTNGAHWQTGLDTVLDDGGSQPVSTTDPFVFGGERKTFTRRPQDTHLVILNPGPGDIDVRLEPFSDSSYA